MRGLRFLKPFVGALVAAAGCQSGPPMKTVDHVDLGRFMGDWFVIANIPTSMETGAHNAVESYRLAEDGTIDTTFTYRKDSFDGELKTYNPKGFVEDTKTNALWGMRFVWPIKADYRIVYLDDDYTVTIIGRQKRDYVWIMARKPEIPAARYEELVGIVTDLGYDADKIQRVPQRWESKPPTHR